MLIKALEKERKEIFKRGKIEGIIEGEIKGKIEGKIEDAKNLLAEGLSIAFISKVTGLSEAEILKLQSKRWLYFCFRLLIDALPSALKCNYSSQGDTEITEQTRRKISPLTSVCFVPHC
jgi:hypothetical protein